MADQWYSIDELPDTHGTLVASVIAANTSLARFGVSQVRRSPAAGSYFGLMRSAKIHIQISVMATQEKVVFLFFKVGSTQELVLEMQIDFEVKVADPMPNAFLGDPSQINLFLRIPPFFATDIDVASQQLLASAVGGGKDLSKLVFLSLGQTYIAGVRLDDPDLACVARLEPGSSKAVVCYQRGLSVTGQVIRYEPQTFLRLMDQVAAWARSGYTTGPLRLTVIPTSTDPRPAARILAALASSWSKARNACPREYQDALIQDLLPVFQIDGFRGEIVLRLKQDGTLAEKESDDAFRLRLSALAEEAAHPPALKVSLGPPDFLVSGDLHDQLVAALQGDAMSHLFANSGLPGADAGRFAQWFAANAKNATVFRTVKDGDKDTDVFVFSGLWDGVERTAVVAATVAVTSTESGFQVKLIGDTASMAMAYTDIPGTKLGDPDPLLPRYFLTLLNQLSVWVRAFGGE